MIETILFEKIWEDDDFFELRVMAKSKIISAECTVYITISSLHKLAQALSKYNMEERVFWENGTKGDSTTPYISIEVSKKDKCGHLLIEVYMELDDGGTFDKHNCCFFINTDIGALNELGFSLYSLEQGEIGTKVQM